ncbi:MAG TPA: hypothetical protein VK116_09875, partial [Planctomycetota bacterium]|nr:hypothetical protein [Planctomycetota bacterium]
MSEILSFADYGFGDGKREGSVHRQRFTVDFDYDVHFTRGLFAPGNRLLADVLDRKREGRRHRALVCIDSGVADAMPDLSARIKAWFHEHQDKAELAGCPEIVPGGEAVKNDWSVVEDLMVAIGNQHLDRQSFVIAIGGGSVLDMVGFVAAL